MRSSKGWLIVLLLLFARLAAADDFGIVVAGMMTFQSDCGKHPDVWKYNRNSFAYGCSPTTASDLLMIYQAKGDTEAAHLQQLGLSAKTEKFPRQVIGGIIGVLPGLGLALAFPEKSGGDMSGLLWLAVGIGGGYFGAMIGGDTAVHADIVPELMFNQAMRSFDAREEERRGSVLKSSNESAPDAHPQAP